MTKSIPEGVRLKIKRANQHLKALKRSVDRFMDKESYDVIRDFKENRLEMDLFVEPTLPLPPTWSLIVGDCLFNLRASLDYLVCHLSSTDCERTQFPITSDSVKFANAKKANQLEGIPGPAATIIEGLQPWKTHPADPAGAPLAVLQALNNLDKHRQLHLTYSVLQSGNLQGTSPANVKRVQTFGIGPMRGRTKIAHIEFFVPEYTMKMNLNFSVGVAFDEQGPARGRALNLSLVVIRNYINKEVLPKFSAFY